MTHTLIERMVGHCTRLAQEAPYTWHAGEEQELAGYLAVSRRLDCTAAWLTALIPRGWLLVGLRGRAPALVAGRGTATTMAVGLGGTLLAYAASPKFATSLGHLASAILAWHPVVPLVAAAVRPQVLTPPAYATPAGRSLAGAGAPPLRLRHRTRSAPVLQGWSLPIRVVAAPQFHDNHVFAGTFAFHLRLGRRWPPPPADVAAAESLCRALDLGPLLDRMPAGLWQRVGETGWQLSHGARSRLSMARALLQGAAVLLRDESFAALDPATLSRVPPGVLAHAPALLVIAHL